MITLDSVSKSYAKGQPAVNNVSLHIEKGEFVFIVGNSGFTASPFPKQFRRCPTKLLLSKRNPPLVSFVFSNYLFFILA